jgi:hypothetical protein
MPPRSNRPSLNSIGPLAMAPSALRTADPAFWPTSSARTALPVEPAVASAGRRSGMMLSWVL